MASESSLEVIKSRFLVSLLPEVMELVLSFEGMPHCVSTLWICGSKSLHRLLQRSVTSVDLRQKRVVAPSRIPSFLLELNRLRSLRIKKSTRFPFPSHAVKMLQLLASKLENFEICGTDLNLFVHSNSEAQSSDNSAEQDYSTSNGALESDIPLSLVLPNLRSLDLSLERWVPGLNLEHIKALPRTLLSLTCTIGGYKSFYGALAQALPPSMAMLKLRCDNKFTDSFFASLPRHLESLDISTSRSGAFITNEQLTMLPSSLTTLILAYKGNYRIETLETARALPKSLTTLWSVRHSPLAPENAASIAMELPRSLTKLSMIELPSSLLYTLPAGLRTLVCDVTFESKPKSSASDAKTPSSSVAPLADAPLLLPSSLTSLRISILGFPQNYYQLFPKTLRSLTVRISGSSIIHESFSSALPSSLSSLEIILHMDQPLSQFVSTLPPHLTHLSLHCRNPSHLMPIPQSVRTLVVEHEIEVSDLFMLPTRLRTLRLGGLRNMHLFNPADPITLARIQELRQVGMEEGRLGDDEKHAYLSSSSSSMPLQNIHVFDLLPRTLDKLDMGGSTNLSSLEGKQWASLPKQMKKLILWHDAQPLHRETLDYLPLESLLKLRTPRVVWRNKHVMRLNPKMYSLRSQPGTRWRLTSKVVRSCPNDILPHIASEDDITLDTKASRRMNALYKKFEMLYDDEEEEDEIMEDSDEEGEEEEENEYDEEEEEDDAAEDEPVA